MYQKLNLFEDSSDTTTVVGEHCVLAEAVPEGAVDDTQERMPV